MSSHRWNQTVTQGSGPSPSYAFSNGTTSNTNHIISGVSYDDAGNMTYDGSYYYTYDGNNRVVGVGTSSGSNNVASYSYNSRGMRVSTTSSGGTVEWMFDLSGNALTASVPGTTQFYGAEYFVGGRDWGTLSTGGVNFRYPDWVGNGRVWQDVAGTVTQQAAYAAFGDGLFAPGGGSCCSLQAGMFDDAWQDSANNTYHTLNREYSPTQGRWLTPDPAGLAAMDVTNPQTWNRYAYVTNNPVSFTDPLGLFVQACFSAPGGGGCDLTGGGGGGGDDGSGPPCYMCGGPGGGGGGYGGEPGSGGPSGPTFAAPVFGGGFGAGCGSDFLPCGATPPGLAEILGLPTWDDVLNPIMDANPAGNCMPGTAGCFNVPTAQQPCYGGSSLTDKTVRFFSLLRLPETWTEWVGGGAAKLTFFGAAKAGATSAGGAEGLGSTAIGIGGEVFGGAGSVAIIGATMADFNCQIGPVDPYTGK
jgi:RHS repeat-associated protein